MRAGLLLVILTGVVALGWLLGGEEDGHPGASPAQAGRESGVGPALAPAGRPAPMPPVALPAWIPRETSSRFGVIQRIGPWLREGRHLEAFIADIVARVGAAGEHAVALDARRWFLHLRGEAAHLAPMLEARLVEPPTALHRAALLSARRALGAVSTAGPDAPLALRVLTACDSLDRGETPSPRAIAALLDALGPAHRPEVRLLLEALLRRTEVVTRCVPALLSLARRFSGLEGVPEQILKVLARVAPTHPEAQDLFLGALGHPQPSVRSWALLALAESDALALLGALADAPPAAQTEGARMLLQRGVGREALGPILLEALATGDAHVRASAVTLLARVAPDPRIALPVIESLLGGEDRGRWLSGTRALGALTTAVGARDDIMRMLFTAARLPDPKVRIAAVQSLLMYDDHAESVVAVLADMLRDTEPGVRREAVDGLGELVAHARAREHLQGALGDPDAGVRKLARYWLDADGDEAGDGG